MMDDIALPVEKAVDGPIARSTPLAAGAECNFPDCNSIRGRMAAGVG